MLMLLLLGWCGITHNAWAQNERTWWDGGKQEKHIAGVISDGKREVIFLDEGDCDELSHKRVGLK